MKRGFALLDTLCWEVIQMNSSEKIALINTLHESVIDYVIEGDRCWEILVPLNDETISVLRQLGKSDEWIKLNKIRVDEDGDVIDISTVGFEFSSWWTNDNGFE